MNSLFFIFWAANDVRRLNLYFKSQKLLLFKYSAIYIVYFEEARWFFFPSKVYKNYEIVFLFLEKEPVGSRTIRIYKPKLLFKLSIISKLLRKTVTWVTGRHGVDHLFAFARGICLLSKTLLHLFVCKGVY